MFLRVVLDYTATRQWHHLTGVDLVRFGDGIVASSIVERDHEARAFSALLYLF